jgi:DNA-binding beta-propeller fold protein YncE
LKLKSGISFASLAGMTAWIVVAVFVQEAGVLSQPPNPGASRSSFTLFESGPVRPLALSPTGKLLFAANTPDNRLEVFRVLPHGLQYRGSVPVGLEPVAVAAPSDDEVWVVNHVSDSVSIVKIGHGAAREKADNDPVGHVVRTLLVGDEPRDIVFAGRRRNRAFVTTAHRGQNVPYDPQLTTPGVGRADVWVFDADNPGDSLTGKPLTIITLFTDTPRALAVTPDGSRVYAAGFLTGNRTTTVFEEVVTAAGGLPEPLTNFEGILQPHTGLIVKFDGAHWTDGLGRHWDAQVKFSLPDKDVFEIDAEANTPVARRFFTGVGTTIFNMIVNPANGHLYVSNTEARNERRFEGAGAFLQQFGQKTVRGNLADSRITVVGRSGSSIEPRHLNKHIDRDRPFTRIPNRENRRSLAFPMDLAISSDGRKLYVAAFGSSKVGVFSTRQLENDTFVPDVANQIRVSGGGPAGLALDEQHDRLYVLTRFNNAISIVDTQRGIELAQVRMHNPEPASIVKGRPFLYDASFTSSRGDSACASCHVFGDFDGLAWDLGDPDNSEIQNNGVFTLLPAQAGSPVSPHFRPMKGPMTTQSLRGLDNHGAMHWRGDRLDNSVASVQPSSGAFDENAAFNKFNVAFEGLNGRNEQLTPQQMQAFTDFALQITYPPNPIRKLDNTLTPDQQAGRDFYFGSVSDTLFTCNGCHVLDPAGNAGFDVARPGFFGTDGRFSFESEPQIFKIPHLRNMYQKVGMFGMPRAPLFLPESFAGADNAFMGDQIRGFGFLHDGSVDTMNRFHSTVLFVQRPPTSPQDPGNPGGFPLTPAGFQLRRQVEQFLLAFDSNLAPIVGQQVTMTARNQVGASARLELFMGRAAQGECDLVAKGKEGGYLYQSPGLFRRDRRAAPLISVARLMVLASQPEGEITFTCVPPGSGVRIGIDRDEDGILDGDDRRD